MCSETVTSLQETLTVKEIKNILNIGTNAAYNLIHSRSFTVVKVGHSYRIPKESFYTWLNSSHVANY